MTEAADSSLIEAIRRAAGSFDGEVVLPDDGGYDAARAVWNAAFDRRPAAVVRCAGTEDVRTALELARRHELPVAVRSGGHSHAGHSACEGGIVIDLRPLDRVRVDPEREIAVVGPGATWGGVAEGTHPYGLAAVGAHSANVGVGGLVLGGGIGWLTRMHGLACDNLLEAEVVTADGQVRRASPEADVDLLWALQGGGGNFGVVTSLTLQLHPSEQLLAGTVLYEGERAREVLEVVAAAEVEAPDEVMILTGLVTAPREPFVPPDLQGRPAVLLVPTYLGPLHEADEALAPLDALGPPSVDLRRPVTYRELQHLLDPLVEDRLALTLRSALLGPLDGDALEALIERLAEPPSSASNVLLTPLGGVVRSIEADATAFPHRDAHWNLEIGAARTDPATDPGPYLEWAEAGRQALEPWSVGVHANHLAEEGPERTREAYGDAHDRLAALKAVYDPDNVFRLNPNVPPAG